ncbi:GGDEF domain-containing protein [Micromonospora sp. NPDC050495]|uniref:GGDEF domain-containing protein n=1 Tax=Micromonospora sp. NPDC050495 TaxID=3154936 RepID=UPI0033FA7060
MTFFDPAIVAGLVAGLSGLATAGWLTRSASLLRRQLAVARHDATHDRLTGLLNRAGLAEVWPRLAPARPFVAVLDLDDFKPINDLRGHAPGDVVLSVIADRLRTQVTSIVARLGGDEFALILASSSDLHAVREVAAAVADPIGLPSGEVVSVTASIGLASADSGDLAEALARADAAITGPKPPDPVSASTTRAPTTGRALAPTPARSCARATFAPAL